MSEVCPEQRQAAGNRRGNTWRYCAGCLAGSAHTSPARVRSLGRGEPPYQQHPSTEVEDVLAGRRWPDTIALGAWGVEWHDRVTYESSFEARQAMEPTTFRFRAL